MATAQTYTPTMSSASGYTAKTYDPTKAQAFDWNVDDKQTVQGQVNNIIKSDSPLMQQAATSAKQQMSGRGLLNSSMAVGAGQNAVISAALPMAQQDANTYAQSGQFNAQNQTGVSTTNAGLLSEAAKYGADAQNQAAQFTANAGNQSNLANAEFSNQAGQFNAGQQNQLTMADVQQKNELAKMEVGQGYNVQNMTLQQQQDLAKMAEQQRNTMQQQTQQQGFQATENAVQRDFTQRMATLEQEGLDYRQAREIASQEAIFKLEQQGVTNRFDQELALKSDMFNAEQINADRRQIIDNEQKLKELGIQIEANKQTIPTSFAANISNTTMQGVNYITSDPNMTAEQKKAAISNIVSYANSQVAWAEKFYGTTIPQITTPAFA